MSLKQPRQKVLMNTNKTPSIVGWMRFIASSIHFITILKLCTARLQRLSHTRASRSSPSFLFELYSTLKASFTMHECTSFSRGELCSDSWKEEGCLEKEGETMRGKMKAFRFHYEHCNLFFSAVYTVHFLHNNTPLPQCACQSLKHSPKWVLRWVVVIQ